MVVCVCSLSIVVYIKAFIGTEAEGRIRVKAY